MQWHAKHIDAIWVGDQKIAEGLAGAEDLHEIKKSARLIKKNEIPIRLGRRLGKEALKIIERTIRVWQSRQKLFDTIVKQKKRIRVEMFCKQGKISLGTNRIGILETI